MADDTIDLHGQFVEEAEDLLKARIRDAQRRGQSHLHVIVGRGNHSAGGVAKIRPRVERLCTELGLDWRIDEGNEGKLFVDLTGGKVPPGGGGGGHGGYQQQGQHHQQQGGHHQQQGGHHQQRPQGQHHQQRPQGQHQQRPQEEENEVEKAVSKCLGCCVIM